MTTTPNIAVVVLSYNGLDDSRKCLASMVAAMRPGVTPLLVDNGSTDGTAAAIATEFPWCQIVRVEENRGPVAGNNAGLRAGLEAGADWILLLNNDTVVDPALIDRLRDAALAHPQYDVIGPVIKFMDDPDDIMTDGTMFNPPIPRGFFLRVAVDPVGSVPPRIMPVDIVNGCCLMIRADMVRRIGFDESIFMYHDELDLCLRVREAGGKAGIIDHSLIWHKGSATSQATGKRSIRYYDARNLLRVLVKHRGAPQNGRSRLLTAVVYFRNMYHWYCDQREKGNDDAALAVIEGICDGFAGRSGRYETRRRWLVAPLKAGFEFARRHASRTPTPSPVS